MQEAFRHVRLRELNSNESLIIACNACGHRSSISPTSLPGRVDREIELSALEGLLSCGRCGKRGRASMTVTQRRA